jgi:hypothetical protein
MSPRLVLEKSWGKILFDFLLEKFGKEPELGSWLIELRLRSFSTVIPPPLCEEFWV